MAQARQPIQTISPLTYLQITLLNSVNEKEYELAKAVIVALKNKREADQLWSIVDRNNREENLLMRLMRNLKESDDQSILIDLLVILGQSSDDIIEKTIFYRDKFNHSLIEYAAWSNRYTVLTRIVSMMQRLNKAKFIQYLSMYTKIGSNILHHSAYADQDFPYFEKAGGLNEKKSCQQFLLAVMKEHLEPSEFFFQLNKSDRHGDSPMHCAILNKNWQNFIQLIVYGADCNMVNDQLESPFHTLLNNPSDLGLFINALGQFIQQMEHAELKKNEESLSSEHYNQRKQSIRIFLNYMRHFFPDDAYQNIASQLSLRDLVLSQVEASKKKAAPGLLRLSDSPHGLSSFVLQEEPQKMTEKAQTLANYQQINIDRQYLVELIRVINEEIESLHTVKQELVEISISDKKRAAIALMTLVALGYLVVCALIIEINCKDNYDKNGNFLTGSCIGFSSLVLTVFSCSFGCIGAFIPCAPCLRNILFPNPPDKVVYKLKDVRDFFKVIDNVIQNIQIDCKKDEYVAALMSQWDIITKDNKRTNGVRIAALEKFHKSSEIILKKLNVGLYRNGLTYFSSSPNIQRVKNSPAVIEVEPDKDSVPPSSSLLPNSIFLMSEEAEGEIAQKHSSPKKDMVYVPLMLTEDEEENCSEEEESRLVL